MRSVLSSTAAFSTEWPSANARSSDCATSDRNSLSAAAEESLWIVDVSAVGSAVGSEREGPEAEVREEVRESAENSDSVSVSDAEVVEPASESSRSEAVSPGRCVLAICRRDAEHEKRTYPHESLVVV